MGVVGKEVEGEKVIFTEPSPLLQKYVSAFSFY